MTKQTDKDVTRKDNEADHERRKAYADEASASVAQQWKRGAAK